jgi:hypothetical protein
MNSRSNSRGPCRLTCFVVLAAATACGPVRRVADEPPATIIFVNESIEQATVYAVAPGVDFRRLGIVFAGQTDTLTVPLDLTNRGGGLNIVARLLARSELPQTGPVTIRRGEQYQVRLPTDAKLLSFLR